MVMASVQGTMIVEVLLTQFFILKSLTWLNVTAFNYQGVGLCASQVNLPDFF